MDHFPVFIVTHLILLFPLHSMSLFGAVNVLDYFQGEAWYL